MTILCIAITALVLLVDITSCRYYERASFVEGPSPRAANFDLLLSELFENYFAFGSKRGYPSRFDRMGRFYGKRSPVRSSPNHPSDAAEARLLRNFDHSAISGLE